MSALRQIHTFIISTILLCVWSACSHTDNSHQHQEYGEIAITDSIMRSLGVALYSTPDSVAMVCENIINDADRPAYAHAYAKTVYAMASLVKGDHTTHDSLLTECRVFADADDTPPLFREFYYRTLGVDNNLLGDNEEACQHTTTALNTALANGFSLLAIEDEVALGDFCQALGKLPEAATHLRRAVALADSTGYNGQRSLMLNLAEVYSAMGNYAEADRYFALHRERRSDYPVYTRFFYHSVLGNSMYYRGNYKDAADNFAQALEIATSTGDPFLTSMSLVNLGESLMLDGDIDSAARYIDEGTEAFAAMGVQDPSQIFYLTSLKGALALRQGKLAEARELLERVSADTAGMPPRYQAVHLGRLADLYAADGNYARALESTRRLHDIETRLTDEHTRQYADELQYRYMQDTIVLNSNLEVARKHEEILQLRSLTWIIVAVAVFALLALCAFSLYQTLRRRQLADEMRASLMSMRLESTRNRISPHFVFNTINNALAEGESLSNDRIDRFVGLIRRNLELAEHPVISLGEELDFVDTYIDFLQHANTESFQFHKHIADDVDTSRMGPSMFIEIFVENAIKHGLRGYKGERHLWLDITRDGDRHIITVTNNGNMEGAAVARGTGMGTRIVNQTIHVLNERNTRKIIMQQRIEDRPGVDGGRVYIVVISIPDHFDYSPIIDKRLK